MIFSRHHKSYLTHSVTATECSGPSEVLVALPCAHSLMWLAVAKCPPQYGGCRVQFVKGFLKPVTTYRREDKPLKNHCLSSDVYVICGSQTSCVSRQPIFLKGCLLYGQSQLHMTYLIPHQNNPSISKCYY